MALPSVWCTRDSDPGGDRSLGKHWQRALGARANVRRHIDRESLTALEIDIRSDLRSRLAAVRNPERTLGERLHSEGLPMS